MANTDSYPQQLEIPTQRLVSEISSPTTQNEAKPSKFYSHFVFKSVLVAIVLVILPLFPTQAPEFVNQTIPDRSWELLHLLFVGIAVSYGLFSRRNVDTEKENQFKIENAQTYVSRMLQVSSVFDEEIENPSGSDEHQIQTWSSRYYRDESSRVVVEEHNSVLDDDEHGNHINNHVDIKPLLLPIRSLRSRVLDSNVVESVNEKPLESSGSVGWSGSGSFDGEFGQISDMGLLDLEKKLKENAVLPSPIPWRSRSGRMVMKEEEEDEEVNAVITTTTTLYSSSVEESEINELGGSRSFPSPKHWSSQPNPASHLPDNPSTAPSFSAGLQPKNTEDMGEMNFPNSSTSLGQSLSHLMGSSYSTFDISNSSSTRDGILEEKKQARRSSKEQKELRRRSREDLSSKRETELYTSKSEAKSRNHTEGSSKGKSVRTVRVRERAAEARKSMDVGGDRLEEKTEKRSKEVDAVLMEKRGKRTGALDQSEEKTEKRSKEVDAVLMEKRGKRTGGLDQLEEKIEKRSKDVEAVLREKRGKRRGNLDRLEEKTEKRSKEAEAVFMEKTGKRTEGFDQLAISNGKSSSEDAHITTHPTPSKHRKKDKKRLVEKVILEYEEYSGSEVDEVKGLSDTKEAASDTVSSAGSDSNEVDKKADEFIAKFREQIRLQRIQSMKSSNELRSGRNSSRDNK